MRCRKREKEIIKPITRHVHRHFGGQVLKPKKRAPNAKKKF